MLGKLPPNSTFQDEHCGIVYKEITRVNLTLDAKQFSHRRKKKNYVIIHYYFRSCSMACQEWDLEDWPSILLKKSVLIILLIEIPNSQEKRGITDS